MRRLAITLTLVLSSVATADPTLVNPDLTVEERLVEAEKFVTNELAEGVLQEGRPLTVSIVDGTMTLVAPDNAVPRATYNLPGGTAILRVNLRGFNLRLPTAGSLAAVEAGTEPIVRYINVFSRPDGYNISSDADFVDASVNIDLMRQGGMMNMEGKTTVTLRATRSNFDGTSKMIEVTEDDLVSLRRKHRDVFDEWALPIFVAIGIDDVLAAEVRATAIAVFLPFIETDEATTQQVLQAITGLDAADFADRSAAGRALSETGITGAAAVSRMLADKAFKLTDEQRAALTNFVEKFEVLPPEEAARLAADPTFLSDVQALDGEPHDNVLVEAARVARQRLRDAAE